jgi:putative redox protein
MSSEMTVQAEWESGYRFDVKTGSGHQVAVDAGEELGGMNSAPSPMEMLLVGLAGCTGINVVMMLKKQKQDIEEYEVKIRGERTLKHPQVFTWIEIEHVFSGRNIQSEAVQRAIDLTEERYCGASTMLGETAVLTHTFRIVEMELQ